MVVVVMFEGWASYCIIGALWGRQGLTQSVIKAASRSRYSVYFFTLIDRGCADTSHLRLGIEIYQKRTHI